MPDLTIAVERASVAPYAAAPTLVFTLRVVNADPAETIHTIMLRCQIQIEVTRRYYSARERENLCDLFGEPARWGQTLRNLLWTHTSTVVPRFNGAATADLQVPCTFDFSLATTKYFDGLAGGEIPVLLLFSGTVFHADAAGALSIAPVAWDKETKFRLPLRLWKEMMDAYYPNNAWLCLRKDIFEELRRFKAGRGIPTLEGALETLLAAAKEEAVRT